MYRMQIEKSATKEQPHFSIGFSNVRNEPLYWSKSVFKTSRSLSFVLSRLYLAGPLRNGKFQHPYWCKAALKTQ